MNKAEFKAISMIAKKMNWRYKPVSEVCDAIREMVSNQQALELDTVGECDDFEETLLSIALWDTDKIISCLYCSDYTSHCNYWYFLKETGMSGMDFYVWMTTYDLYRQALAEEYEMEEMAMYDAYFDKWENSYC